MNRSKKGFTATVTECLAVVVAGFSLFAAETVSPAVYSPKPTEPFYQQAARSHTGIPSIAVSPKNGRLWLTCYCAWKDAECAYNYVPLLTSVDGGKTWRDVLVVDPDGEGLLRVFDPELFVNDSGKLVWSWTERRCDPANPLNGCGASPKTDRLMFVELDAENEPVAPYPEARFACRGVMMCKPIRLADGRTLLPVSHWFDEPSACFYATKDWKTFDFLGGVTLPRKDRQFDEHSVIQCADGSLKTWVRTGHEPRESVSTDGGKTWSEPVVSQVGNPNSRLFCTKLKNGHLFMVKHGKMHEHFKERGWLPRRELHAFVSRDDGRTWEGDLLIDERTKGLSYPDGDVSADGSVYVTYDRDRMVSGEILVAHVTEEDVLAGKLVSKGSFLRGIATTRPIHSPDTASGTEVLPLGAVRPEGWLKVLLERQRDSLTGCAERRCEEIGKSAWLGVKGGDVGDSGPLYARGLVALALTLGDEGLKAKARRWIDAIVASQRANGDIGPKNDNWWPNMPAICAVRDWTVATGDERGVPFLRRYFRYQFDRLRQHPLSKESDMAVARAGDNMEVVLWLAKQTREEWLTALADLLATQSRDWESCFRRGGEDGGQLKSSYQLVNFMHGLKEPALASIFGHSGNEKGSLAYNVALDPKGWWMRQYGRDDRMLKGMETCVTAERIISCQAVLSRLGWYGSGLAVGDDLEASAYDLLPKSQKEIGRNAPALPNVRAECRCCRANCHVVWPKLVQSMWMKGAFHMGGGLVAIAYGPCTVTNALATIEERGDYPFDNKVTMRFVRTNGEKWPLTLRQPRRCGEKEFALRLNGEIVQRDRWGQIRRKWEPGDTLEIVFGEENKGK